METPDNSYKTYEVSTNATGKDNGNAAPGPGGPVSKELDTTVKGAGMHTAGKSFAKPGTVVK